MDEIMIAYINDLLKVSSLDLPWEKLEGKNVLITGASGLIGGCLVDMLMLNPNINYHVYASGRNKRNLKERFCSYLSSSYFSILEYDVTKSLSSDIDFHYIVAAASGASPQIYSTNPVGVIKANILGVDNLLSYGVEHSLEKFIYISSGEVYGEGDGRVFDEDYSGYVNCASVRACYPSSKRASETLCEAYAHQYGVDVSIVRPCHVYGPRFTPNDKRVYAQFIRNVLKGEDIVMKSDGKQFRSWCYVVDCISAIMYVMLKGKNGDAYNIADETSNISIRSLAEMIATISGQHVVVDLPTEIEKTGFNVVTKSVFSTKKLEKLGWTVRGTMFEKMEKTIMESKDFVKL